MRSDFTADADDVLELVCPATLRDVFFRQCRKYRSVVAFVELGGDLDVIKQLTYEQLERNARDWARTLSATLPAGASILLALDGGINAVELFWAAILAGMIPIPVPAANASTFRETAYQRLLGIERHAGASLVIAEAKDLRSLAETVPATWTSLDALKAAPPRSVPPGRLAKGHDIAYLQYTSGSTSEPRGVEILHANAIAQCSGLQKSLDTQRQGAAMLTWLPWFHDYGLVQGVLLPVYTGATSYLMPTGAFIRRPLRWLEAIARFDVTYSGAPDTGYLACIRALARQPQWSADLRNWTVATCGAEPVRADTYRSFSEAFAPHGFKPESFCPAYGLAECVLGVTSKATGTLPYLIDVDADALEHNLIRQPDEHTRTSRTLVGCGTPLECCEIKIVDPTTCVEQPDSAIGEIWIKGPSVSRGYHRDEKRTQETFGAHLADSSDDARYLRTGDLGALHDGELLVTGRIKDLIVVTGRNLYPHDLELTAQTAHAEIREGGVIAFGIDRPEGEGVVVVAESTGAVTEAQAHELVDAVASRLGAEHGVEVCDVVILRRGTLRPTSSGKPRRAVARQRYLAGEFDALRVGAPRASAEPRKPRDATELIVADVWMEVLGLSDCDVEANFFLLGGNSLHATQLASRLTAALGTPVPLRVIFETPTIAGIASALRNAAHEGGTLETAPPLPIPREAHAAHRLSFSQERIWFICQQAPESTAYHMPLAIRLRGKCDAAALEVALAQVVQRHDVLRTTFSSDASGVVAHVHDSMAVKLRRTSLAALRIAPDDEALKALLSDLAREPFDFATGPLIRADLIELAPNDSVLLIVKHHIVGDQWSFAVLLREIAHLYRARLGIETEVLPPLPLQYGDYAAWQRSTFETKSREREEAYWKGQLEGLEAATLHADHQLPPSVVAHQGARIRLEFEPELIKELTAAGARHSASLSMVLIAALQALIQRYTAHQDVVIGLPVANRHHFASEALIGSFVNVLALRTQVDAGLDFPLLLERVKQNSLDAFAHQDMPFELLVHTLRADRDAGRTPLFQVLFNMINTPLGSVDFGGLELSRVEFDRHAAQFDLSITVDPQFDQSISFEYATELFEPHTIEQFASRYVHLLGAITRGETRALSEWPLMDETEAARIKAWSHGAELTPPFATVTDWLEEAFARHSADTAVVFKGERITYAQLDERSRQVAYSLQQRGIARGHRVGICATRCVEMLLAQLGVIRSGATYVPLDPVNPPARLKQIAGEASLSLILTAAAPSEALCEIGDVPRLEVSDAIGEGAPPPALVSRAQPDDTLYVLYTSGSTGRPKGVSVPHRAVTNLLASVAQLPGMDASDRLLAITPLGFDISVTETLLPLVTGAQIVLASSDDVHDGAALWHLVDSHDVTVVQATPTTWELLLRAGWTGSPSLKRALVTGEALSPKLAKSLLAQCPQVWNLYGPTETTVWSSLDRVEDADCISIGRPIHNTQAYVLDPQGRICPAGIEGELYIGGACVSDGYLDQPATTSERFVADAISGGDGKLYRTGDLVRWQHDGKLLYLGRIDTQVKLRGYRIEPTEIEEVLSAHSQVAQAAVAVTRSATGEPMLVAYVVARAEAPSEAALRQHVRRLLPAYMVPQHFIAAKALPVLSSGKLDRKSLSALKTEALPTTQTSGAPRNATERAMWMLWREVLEIESFGIDDNFFDLGGHSMMALRLVNRITTRLDSRCTPPMLFQNPTVAGLCEALRHADDRHKPSLVTLQPEGDEPPLFCICGIDLYQALADQLAPHRPVYGIFLPCESAMLEGRNNPFSSSAISVEELAAEYLSVMRTKQPHGPYYLAGLSFGGLLAFEIARQLTAAGEQVALLAMLDTMVPQGRARVLAHRILHKAKSIREKGVIIGPRNVQQRLAGHTRALGAKVRSSIGSPTTAQSEDERLITSRDAIYRRAMYAYMAKPYSGRAILFHALDCNIPDTSDRWRALIDGLEVVNVPGDHLGLLKAPHVATVAETIKRALRGQPHDRANRAASLQPLRASTAAPEFPRGGRA